MNVIVAIVINMNCYFIYLEQLENKMHLNVPKYDNDNNKIIHYLRTSALSLSLSLSLSKIIFYFQERYFIILINHKL